MKEFEEKLTDLVALLKNVDKQSWLLGAGISYESKIPLMFQLTYRITKIIYSLPDKKSRKILFSIKSDLESYSHVEHYLSHLGDLIAMAERAKAKCARVGKFTYTLKELTDIYDEIIKAIGETIRYGYVRADKLKGVAEQIGSVTQPIVEIDAHHDFVTCLLLLQQNLERRSRLTFFTLNYDTLLEDALTLSKKTVCDGFSGGAVGYWNGDKEFARSADDSNTVKLYKLHGSIDWHHDDRYGLVRSRYGTKYLASLTNIMIYPQATKYIETQKDPFASLFTAFRKTLNDPDQGTLICCGYSFGDEHINTEIKNALYRHGNKTTLIVFINESNMNGAVVNPTLDRWLECSIIGKRVYVIGSKGIYYNSLKPYNDFDPSMPAGSNHYDWWTFAGMTRFIMQGGV